jgi:UDP-glucose 4-epimerase|tara:strand:- start:525 stop:1484 length:960 start_codon:yes stop_codon:yes gene_type:complete
MNKNVKKILLTGAAGFVGSHLAKELLILGYELFTIDNLSTGKIDNIPKGVHVTVGDCADKELVFTLDNHKFYAIFHIAGQSSGEISFSDPECDLKSNTLSTINLLELSKKTHCKKFIYASTMSVYGDIESYLAVEDLKLNPKSFYAVGKLASENYMRIYQDNYDIKCVALRLFNCYGVGQNMDNLKQGMVSIFLAMALLGDEILVKGSPDRFRDFVYIDDVVNAFVKSINLDLDTFEVINVASGKKTYVKELINSITQNINKEIKVEYSNSTLGDQFGIFGDNSKALKLLDWKPTLSFQEGIKHTIKHYLNEKNINSTE